MKKTLHPIPVADLSDEVWTIDHIAAYMPLRSSAAYARIRQAGFPEPFTGNCRHRRWLAVEVKAYFASAQPRTAPAPASSGAAALRPRVGEDNMLPDGVSGGARPFRYEVVKAYPPWGPLVQFRMSQATSFMCHRCGEPKTSKLLALLEGDWNRPLCNGCYGYLLSVWAVKSGNLPEDERADALRLLASSSISLALVEDARQRIRSEWFAALSRQPQVEVATADAIVDPLRMANGLDWSCVVLVLCKAVEIELVKRLFEPLRAAVASRDLSSDLQDKEFGPIARYCTGRGKEPELGTMARFLNTAVNSTSRLESPLTIGLREVASRWALSDWLFERSGLISDLQRLTSEYRNPAAHLTMLDESGYNDCRALVAGDNGLLASLVAATQRS